MTKTVIIAEAGVNHNGNMETAFRLIDTAAEAGVDYVKFQTFKAEKIASKSAEKAAYQKVNTGEADGQLAMLKKLELDKAAHLELQDYCRKKNVRFLSTPFDLDSIDLLKDMHVEMGKVPSGEITNLPYLRKMALTFKELVVSTGMCDMEEIAAALNAIIGVGFPKDKITVLHCNTEYPTPMQDVNLLAMLTIRDRFGVKVGYSDHTQGIEVPTAAVALGACLIEKHFTLDRHMDGPDHIASLEPDELTAMVKAIRNIELALGSKDKMPSPSERKNLVAARKSIVAARPIRSGEIFSEINLTAKRPGTGLSPMQWDAIIGKSASRDFEQDELISL